MKNGRFAIVAGVAFGALVTAQGAFAAAPYVTRASVYQIKFVRAMDECVGPFITTVNPGSVGGCAQANVVTDNNTGGGLTGLAQGNLKISRRKNSGAFIRMTGKGFAPPGTDIGLQLTLRTTNRRGLPAATSKTYEDTTVICGSTSGGSCGNYSDVQGNGRIVLRQSLVACLAANGIDDFLGSGNVEIIDSSLINCATGKVVGVPGILQEPLQ